MKTFVALVHKDKGSAWGVTFPDLPGCFSAADALADVVPRAREALDLWFEDRHMIEPRNMEAIQAALGADMADGAFLVEVAHSAAH